MTEPSIDFIYNKYFKGESIEETNTRLKKISARNSESIHLFAEAMKYWEKEQLEKSLCYLNRAIKNESNKGYYYFRGLCKFELEDYKGALKDLEISIKNKREIHSIKLFLIAECKYELKNFKGAIKELDQLIKFNFELSDDFYSRAGWKYRTKDFQGAIEDLNKSIELRDNFGYLDRRAKCKYELKDFKGAKEDLEKKNEIDCMMAISFECKAESKYELKDFQGAIEDLDKCIEISDSAFYRFFFRAKCKYELKDFEGALNDLEKDFDYYYPPEPPSEISEFKQKCKNSIGIV
jgi:tetratricopeptide (TPR) repeat protein